MSQPELKESVIAFSSIVVVATKIAIVKDRSVTGRVYQDEVLIQLKVNDEV